ncbi:MAG TPA: SRPBCC domain-containing protein, partial [Nonomuraea sp.]|nr:SRPBCC domain-containing protein [Nonomuraea sp.]
ITWVGTFLEVDEPHRLVLALADEAPLREPYETYVVTLTEQDGKTELVVSQGGGNLTPEQYEGAKAGTAVFLDTMAELLESLQR